MRSAGLDAAVAKLNESLDQFALDELYDMDGVDDVQNIMPLADPVTDVADNSAVGVYLLFAKSPSTTFQSSKIDANRHGFYEIRNFFCKRTFHADRRHVDTGAAAASWATPLLEDGMLHCHGR